MLDVIDAVASVICAVGTLLQITMDVIKIQKEKSKSHFIPSDRKKDFYFALPRLSALILTLKVLIPLYSPMPRIVTVMVPFFRLFL